MIQTAVQKGNFVYVYNEKGIQIFSKSGTLHGFTASSVSVKIGNFIYVYNEKGNQIASHSAN
jgi:hypothetical protein